MLLGTFEICKDCSSDDGGMTTRWLSDFEGLAALKSLARLPRPAAKVF